MRRPAIERLLPAAYQRAVRPGSILAALLDVMEGMHAPSEDRLAAVDELFSPYRAPDAFVPLLARWVALDPAVAGSVPAGSGPPLIPTGRLRDLVARGAAFARQRGTAAGLRAVVETATGVSGLDVEEPPDRPFHVVVRVPAGARPYLELIRRLVEAEKPAAVTCEVSLADPDPMRTKGSDT